MSTNEKANKMRPVIVLLIPILMILTLAFLAVAVVVCPIIWLIVSLMSYSQSRRFLRENKGKTALIISGGNRMQGLIRYHSIVSESVDLVVTYDLRESNKGWLKHCNPWIGFPQLVHIGHEIELEELKEEYKNYGRRAISRSQFYAIIKNKTNKIKLRKTIA